MNTMHHYHTDRPSPLEIKQLAEFDATLGDLPEHEKKQRRIIYLRDAMQQIDLGKSMFKSFGCLLIPFLIIPIFWPFLLFFWLFFRNMRKKMETLLDNQLKNALDYWQIQEYEVTREF